MQPELGLIRFRMYSSKLEREMDTGVDKNRVAPSDEGRRASQCIQREVRDHDNAG